MLATHAMRWCKKWSFTVSFNFGFTPTFTITVIVKFFNFSWSRQWLIFVALISSIFQFIFTVAGLVAKFHSILLHDDFVCFWCSSSGVIVSLQFVIVAFK